MGRSRRVLPVAAALVLGGVLSTVSCFAASSAARSDSVPSASPPSAIGAAPPQRTTERLRFEPAAGAAAITVGGVGTYRGAIEVTRAGGGLAVINEVGFEDYVKGISEVPSGWPIEALKAQAIAARTYALWEYRRRADLAYKRAGADICATQACQVYTGVAKERAEHGDRWAAAVESTRSEVLWWRDGPIVAKYSSSNGGESVPGGQPYLRAVHDPDDAHSPLHQWRVSIGAPQLAAAVGLAPRVVTAIQRVGDEVLITAKHDPVSADEAPAHLGIDALALRDRLNEAVPAPGSLPRTLPTVRFNPVMSEDGSAVHFDGRGWGHGIGLSQWGAFGKAARGMKAPDILATYYAGLRPVAVPPPHVPGTIKVAVALGHGPTKIAPADGRGHVRVLDSATGEVLSHGDADAWTVAPAAGEVSGAAAAAEVAPATVSIVVGPPPILAPGEAIEVRVRVDRPAIFTATAMVPGAAARVPLGEPARQVDPGEIALALPPAATPGRYTVTIDTDRGSARRAATTISFDVVDPKTSAGTGARRPPAEHAPTRGASSPRPSPHPHPWPAALFGSAAVAVVAAATARTAALGRNRPSPLH